MRVGMVFSSDRARMNFFDLWALWVVSYRRCRSHLGGGFPHRFVYHLRHGQREHQCAQRVPWGSLSYVMARWLRYGLTTITGCASKTLTASSQAGFCGHSSRRTFMQVLRSMDPKAFLKSRQATTCVGLSARCAFNAVVIASPLWGVPMPIVDLGERFLSRTWLLVTEGG